MLKILRAGDTIACPTKFLHDVLTIFEIGGSSGRFGWLSTPSPLLPVLEVEGGLNPLPNT